MVRGVVVKSLWSAKILFHVLWSASLKSLGNTGIADGFLLNLKPNNQIVTDNCKIEMSKTITSHLNMVILIFVDFKKIL